MTLAQMIENALRRANVIRPDQSASAQQGVDGIRLFNGLMARYDQDSVDLGDFPIAATTDTLDLEREHEEAVEMVFALKLAKHSGVPLEEGLIDDADGADKFLRRNTTCKPDWKFPGPRGRGHRHAYDINVE